MSTTTPPSSPPLPPSLRNPPSRPPPSFPAREDCWTEEATHTLISSWGAQFLELNRGNLRQKHWQEVADKVNALHAHTKKQYRTDIQCKNRIDTLKKRFKIEKSQIIQSNGQYVSTWVFFDGLDRLIGDGFIKNGVSVSPPEEVAAPPPGRTAPVTRSLLEVVRDGHVWKLPPPSAVPVGPRSKRPVTEGALSRRNFSAMAAAAARVDEDEEEEDEGSDMLGEGIERGGRKENRESLVVEEGYRRLAEAIGRFAEVYERVEESKQRQLIELEKQRMQFTKELEIQRMKLFMESQVHIEKFKRIKPNSSDDE
ncbi:hypothetical protein Leryth_018441 [Lithospermum erythrorhizon]|nr:hypothetical protein Leryth_018441 [Lithospermum erythrorhizon]